MNLDQRITILAESIGYDIGRLLGTRGNLATLNTIYQDDLVGAINEVAASTGAGALLASNNLNDVADVAVARTNLDVLSAAEVAAQRTAAINAITLSSLGGLTQAQVDARVQLVVDAAPAALDTLSELADALNNDPNFATTITNTLTDRVAYTSQNKTAAEKLIACNNIGVGNYDRDFANDYATSRDAVI